MADEEVDNSPTFFSLFRFHPDTSDEPLLMERRIVEAVLFELAFVATKAQIYMTTVESCYAVKVDLRTALDALDVLHRLRTIRDDAKMEYNKRFAAARTAGFPTELLGATMASCSEALQKDGGRSEQQVLEELIKEHRKPGGRLMPDASAVLNRFMNHGQAQKEETTA